MTPEQIAQRAAAIRLPRCELAKLAKLDKTTVGRTLNALTQPTYDTVTKMERGVLAEERSLLEYLIKLHGVPEQRSAA